MRPARRPDRDGGRAARSSRRSSPDVAGRPRHHPGRRRPDAARLLPAHARRRASSVRDDAGTDALGARAPRTCSPARRRPATERRQRPVLLGAGRGARRRRGRAPDPRRSGPRRAVRRDGDRRARAGELLGRRSSRRWSAPGCRPGSRAARGGPIRPAAPSWRCSPAPPTTCRRAASPSTCRSARCRGATRDRPLGARSAAARRVAATRRSRRASCRCSTLLDSARTNRGAGAQPAAERRAEPAAIIRCCRSSAATCGRPGAGSRCSSTPPVASEAGPMRPRRALAPPARRARAPSWSCACGELKSDEPEQRPRSPPSSAISRRSTICAASRCRSSTSWRRCRPQARWGDWLDRLAALAPRALRHPTRVLRAARRPAADGRGRTGHARAKCGACCCRAWPSSIAIRRSALRPRLRRHARRAARPHLPRRLRAGLAERVFPQRAARIRCCSTRCAAALGRAARRRGRSRRRRAPAPAPRRRRRDRALLAVVSAPRRRPGRGRACRRSTRSTSCARSTGAVPGSRPLRARHRDRDRRLAGVAGARRSGDRRSTSGSTTSRCSAALLRRSGAEPPAKGAAHYLLELNAALRAVAAHALGALEAVVVAAATA